MGRYTGSAPGFILVNLDDLGDHYAGTVFISPDKVQSAVIPTTVAFIKTQNKATRFAFPKLALGAFNAQTNQIDTVQNVRAISPGVDLPAIADVDAQLTEEKLSLNWTTEFGLKGSAALPRSRAKMPSDYRPKVLDWKRFKTYFSGLEGRTHIFRGQKSQARLCSKFHRSGRSDLSRFLSQDIVTLHKRLSARTKHVFNLTIGDEFGAFLNLAQHHGYPTPLLDWTESPYVAAFFAYRGISSAEAKSAKKNSKVRIFAFNRTAWHTDYNPILLANGPYPNFTINEFIAIENERMIPQQAISSVTNIDDVEAYIRSREANGKSYLQMIDLPVRERDLVIRELSAMGITAGSLFPGLDGACEELRERFFQT